MTAILFVLTFLIQLTAQATVYTTTHAYILSVKSSQLLAINRKTNEEEFIKVGRNASSFQIYKDYGYCVDNGCGVRVVDLELNTVVKTIDMACGGDLILYEDSGYISRTVDGREYIAIINLDNFSLNHIDIYSEPIQIMAHGDYAYVLSKSGALQVIDLKKKAMTYSLSVTSGTIWMYFHGDKGYFFKKSGAYTVIELATQKFVANRLVAPQPMKMIAQGDFAYVTHENSSDISCINLKEFKPEEPIKVEGLYVDFYINENTKWLIRQDGTVQVLSFENITLIFEYPASSIVFHEGYAYVAINKGNQHIVIVLDLSELTIVLTIDNPNNEQINFNDSHIYLGIERHGIKLSNNSLVHRCLLAENSVDLLDRGGISHYIDNLFNPFDFLDEHPQSKDIIDELWSEDSVLVSYIFYIKNAPLVSKKFFKKALRSNDPYARAVMYTVFKNGLLGTNGLEVCANFYREGAHEKTIEQIEARLLKNSNKKWEDLLDIID